MLSSPRFSFLIVVLNLAFVLSFTPPALAQEAEPSPFNATGATALFANPDFEESALALLQGAKPVALKILAYERKLVHERKVAKLKKQKLFAATHSRFYGRKLALYQGPMEPVSKGYAQARGEAKKYLGWLHQQPKTLWMGKWISDSQIYSKTRAYIEESQRGNPEAVVTIASFRLPQWYRQSYRGKPTAKEAESYKHWIREQARAIGNTPTIIILQPDMPFLMTARHAAAYAELVRYAAKTYGALPKTKLYLEAGASDWPAAGQGGAPAAVAFLKTVGMEHADGIALNSTHYADTNKDVKRSQEIIDLLHKAGYKQDLRAVINTSSSGNPWEFGTFQFRGIADEAPACTSQKQFGRVTCVTLGIPPTFDVTNSKWGLAPATNKLAETYVDAYLWFGRPWLHMQASPLLPQKAVTMVKSSPYYKS